MDWSVPRERRNLVSAHVLSHFKTKSGFCACAITFQLASTYWIGGWVDPRGKSGNFVIQKNLLPPSQDTNRPLPNP